MPVQNAHMVTATYLPATNTKGARIRLFSNRYNESVTFSFDPVFNTMVDCAVDWLQTRGAEVLCTGAISARADAIAVRGNNGRFVSLKAIKAGALAKG